MELRRIRQVVRWTIVSLVVVGAAYAEEAVILPLVINGVSRGDVFATIADDGDVWIETAALERGEVLIGDRGQRKLRDGQELVSLRSLAPEVAFELDLAALELRIHADPMILSVARIGRASARPENLENLPAAGGFLNYRATLVSMDDLRAFAEGGWSVLGRLLYSSAILDVDGEVRRGVSNLTIDQPERLRRITLGDTLALTDSLGGTLPLAGITVAREFLLDPYFVRFPALDLAGAVTTPSTVEIFLNGAMVDRREIPPGRFEIDQVSLPAGRGSATVVVRDALGGERTIVKPFYASSLMLEEGLSEYSYSLGVARENEGTESFDYGDAVFVAAHRRGFSKRLTAGYRAEASKDVVSAGGSVATRSLAGEFSLHAGASSSEGESGAALSARYAFVTRRLGLSLGWTEVSDSYATLSLSTDQDRSVRRTDALAFFRHGRLDLSLAASLEEHRDRGSIERIEARGTYPISQRGTLFVSAGTAMIDHDRSPVLAFGMTWNLGFLRSASLSADRRNDQSTVTATVQQNLAREPGWGYRVEGASTEGEDTSAVRLQRQTRSFLFDADAYPSMGSDAMNVSAAGGLAFSGRGVHLMRPAQQSYAIVRVPGVPGVRVYVSNLEAGRTNAKGELVVTDLIAYYGNRIRIEDADIPINYRIRDTERVVAPPLRGGVVVEFDVSPVTSLGGVVHIQEADGSIRVPATGELRLRSESRERLTSPLGRGAEFWFENLVPGEYEAEIIDESGVCHMTLRVAPSVDPIQDLGTIVCKETAP